MSTAPAPPQRLILARPDRIGDVIITSSCFAAVRQALPGAELHFLAQAQMEPLFEKHPALTSFIAIPALPDPAQRTAKLTEQLRKLDADCIVHLHSDPAVEVAAAVAGIPRRLGFRLHGRKFLTESMPYEKQRGEKHEAFYNFDLLKLLQVPAPLVLSASLSPEVAARGRLLAKLPAHLLSNPYAVFHIGAHGNKPRIASEFFTDAARWLIEQRQCSVVMAGTQGDGTAAGEILKGLGEASASVYNFIGQTDLAETAFLLERAVVVFGRDSGPGHLAAAMGARTVTLMLEPEPENSARRWQPLSPHSWVLEKPLHRRLFESRQNFARRNLRQFRPAEIIATLQTALQAR